MPYQFLEPWTAGPPEAESPETSAPKAAPPPSDPTSPRYWLDLPFFQAFAETLIAPWTKDYFQVKVEGIERIPAARPALLTMNHSGMGWPWDAILLIQLLAQAHGYTRAWVARGFALPFFFSVPGLQQLVLRVGLFPASTANLHRLLDEQELVLYFPEGLEGIAKGWQRRYQMQKCHTSFVRAAVKHGAPVVPVVCLGAEELNPYAVNLEGLAKAVGLPLFPLSPLQLALFPTWLTSAVFALPVPIRYVVGDPIRFKLDPETATEADYHAAAEEYRAVLQALLDRHRPEDAPVKRVMQSGVSLLGQGLGKILGKSDARRAGGGGWGWTLGDRVLAATPVGWPLLYLRFWNEWQAAHGSQWEGAGPEWRAFPLDRLSEAALLVPWGWVGVVARYATHLKHDRLGITRHLLHRS